MTVSDFLAQSTKRLQEAGIETARLDVLILLEDELQLDRSAILAHSDLNIDSLTEIGVNNKIAQRINHTPLAYIRSKADFYGRSFMVNPDVLVPRPETEAVIELLKTLPMKHGTIADVGTGSGCIGLTAALEFPNAHLWLSDIDNRALQVAKKNAENCRAKVNISKSDLLKELPPVKVILANLPYVPEGYKINRAAKNEPKHAIFSGKDGLDTYLRLWEQISLLSQKPSFVIAESLPIQHASMTKLASAAGFWLIKSSGFVQLFSLPVPHPA